MEEIKLWEITTEDSGQLAVQALPGVGQAKNEEQLEKIMVQRPELLMKDLRLVGRQTAAAGGALDLLGVDGDGRLVVFELKRGTLNREAVAQIIDYASYLSELDLEELAAHISERSGNLGIEKIDNFQTWYQEQFAKNLSMVQKPRMVLVGLGVDDRTRRMVSFLAGSDIDISLVTFHGFEQSGKVFLARQVEVEAKSITGTTTATKKDNLERLKQRVNNLGIGGFYYKMSELFRDRLSAYEWPNPSGFSYYLVELTEAGSESNRVYVSLYIYDTHPGKVQILLNPRAIEAAANKFQSFKEKISDRITIKRDGAAEIWVKSLEEWEELVPHFTKLCAAISDGWKKKREQHVVAELEATEQVGKEEEIQKS